jgi:tRNA(His) 5'-end guanylyltransferase
MYTAYQQQQGCMQLPLQNVLVEFPDIRIAYGESDEYSFVFHRKAELYGR